ncbi:hypothetical protein OC861_003813 [Tilletia horrida]|nr:hypothetical protein OC861_003813 [Tilletia horrida]
MQPACSGFLLTDLLPKGHDPPRGWSELVAEGVSQSHDYHLQVRKRTCRLKDFPPAGRCGGVDLLVIDPPYPNYSADRLSGRLSRKRKRDKEAAPEPNSGVQAPDAYLTVDLYDLWALKTPVRDLLQSGGSQRGTLVAVWVTHHPKAKGFIIDKLFPAWNVTFLREMPWLKVLASPASVPFCAALDENVDHGCKPIYEAGGGRKSYEVLVLGRFGRLAGDTLPMTGFAGRVAQSRQAQQQTEADLRPGWTWTDPLPQDEKHIIIASVPVGHSTKPYLVDALSRHLPRRCPSSTPTSTQEEEETTSERLFVELFARGVLGSAKSPGTVQISVGDEAVKRNVIDVTLRPLRRQFTSKTNE